jgi:ATP-dependent DNA helicase UvrD/PcrA
MTDIILGPPGTGKTTTLISRVEDAIKRGVPPDRIGYFSFTRRAAQEAVDRACEKFGLTREDFPHFSTLHSMCYRQLGVKRGEVLEGTRMKEFARHAGIRLSGRWSEDGTFAGYEIGDRILFMENLARIRGVKLRDAYDEFDDGLPWNLVNKVAHDLADYKKEHGLLDFTDMLTEFVKSGIRLKLTELMIDESQDLSVLQWLCVAQLSRGCQKTAVAGDDDQAIYRWAGADVDHLIDMKGDVSVLGQSYRVPPVIQQVANSIVSRITKRRMKIWNARQGATGVVDYAKSFRDVDSGAGQTLVLARNAYVIREQVEPWLKQQGIVYERGGHSSINLKLLGAIQNWEKLRRGQSVTAVDARTIYDWMSSGRGVKRGFKTLPDLGEEDKVTLKMLQKKGGLLREDPWFEAMDRIDREDVGYIRAARERGEKLRAKPRVVVSTIHGAKGGEADHVILMKEMAIRTFAEMRDNQEDEMRVWYVGVTRAREKLTLVQSDTKRSCPWL